MRPRAAAVLLIAALAGPARARVPQVRITDATVEAPSGVGQPCPVTLTFHATVHVDMKGRFTYEWKRSTGEVDTKRHEAVESDGVHGVVLTEEWSLGEPTPDFHPYHGWMKLYVRSPQQVLSDPASFTIDCGPPLPAGDGEAR